MLTRKRYAIIFIFIVLAAIFHFSLPNIPEPDSFYYMRLGDLYRTRGLFDTTFPWLPHTSISGLTSSLWYGFGVFMIPFSYLGDQILGIKVAGLILTIFALTAYYIVVKRHSIIWPWLWPLLLFFTAPNVLFTFLMTRPQLISFGLAMLLFSLLVSGGWLGIFLTSAWIAWFHLNFAWLPIVILGAVFLAKIFIEKKVAWKNIAAVFGGILLGWLSRPEALKAAKLFYIQIFKLIFEQQSGLPLLFGNENLPLSANILFKNFWPLLIVWLATIGLLWWMKSKKLFNQEIGGKTFTWSSLLLSMIFFLLTVAVARKAYGLWAGFSFLFIGATLNRLVSAIPIYQQKTAKQLALGILLIVLVFTGFYSSIKTLNSLKTTALPPDKLQEVGLWLKENSQTGDIVFNLHWSDFSPLYFWNQNNYYIGGLDPIFQYDYNPSLYWKFHYLSADQVTKKTCGAIECTKEMLVDTYDVLVNEFKAKYVVLTKQQNPLVYSYLESESRFEKKLDTKREAVYLIK